MAKYRTQYLRNFKYYRSTVVLNSRTDQVALADFDRSCAFTLNFIKAAADSDFVTTATLSGNAA